MLAQWNNIGPTRAGPVRAGVAVLCVHGRTGVFTDVFHRVALTLDRVPSVGWCNRFEYALLLLLLLGQDLAQPAWVRL